MMKKSASELVGEAKQQIENLTPDQVAKELEAGALLVDVRESEERKQLSIPGSVFAPRGMLEFYADPSLPYHKEEFTPDRRIILHCASGGRSALSAATLKQMGYENVAHLDGGIKAWQEAGQPTQPGD
ncbi:MAG TPA: rhodanese-like domain-containing protein [Actinomycetota bacterium]|nr:rhodanese-like domain-containing protein [Actinomycetota bacterium]